MHRPTNKAIAAAFAAAFVLLSACPAGAAYYNLIPGIKDPKEAIECLTYETRQPYWTVAIYHATYPQHAISREGWTAPYYGGLQPQGAADGEKKIGVLYSSWQMGGKDAPSSGIAFVHAGPGMSWSYSNWEGSSGGVSGQLSRDILEHDQWSRFVQRVWRPTSGKPHTGYSGIWMKNLKTGRWYHLATIKFPAELTGFVNLGGFIEPYSPASSEKSAIEFRNCYSLRMGGGAWRSENRFSASSSTPCKLLVETRNDGRSVIIERINNPIDPEIKKVNPNTNERIQTPNTDYNLTVTQPEQPDLLLERAWADQPSAEVLGGQVIVRWQMDDTSVPQLGYVVKVYEGDTCVSTINENAPEARQCAITLPAAPQKQVRVGLSIRDIFNRTTKEIRLEAVAVKALDPVAKSKAGQTVAPGLAYRYYETDKPETWSKLPDFAKLAPKRTGVVATPDITPRLTRRGYAFEYSGYLRVPATGIYTFDMVVGSGGKLTIQDQTVIDADGDRSIAQYSGAIALKAGLHPVRIEYYFGALWRRQADDFLQLHWAGPGLPRTSVPASAFFRKGDGRQPSLTAKARMLGDATIELSNQLNGAKATRMAYYAVNENFPYFQEQGADRFDYLLAETERPAESVQACIWGGPRKTIRARAYLEDGSTIDSAPVTLEQSTVPPVVDASGKKLTELEYHLYPAARDVNEGGITLVGDSMTLLTRPHKGDVTLVARVADLITDKPMSDGTRLSNPGNWFSGIILRNTSAATPGRPLGGAVIPFIAVMVNASEDLLQCDSTMINGAGNQPVGLGKMEGARWLKLTRKGQTLSAFVSKDGTAWKMVKTISLPAEAHGMKIPVMGEEIQVGFVQYSIPSATPRIQWSKFDNLSIKNVAE